MKAQETLLALITMDGVKGVNAALRIGLDAADFTDEHCRGVYRELLKAYNAGQITDSGSIMFNVLRAYDLANPHALISERVMEASALGAISASIPSLVPEVKLEGQVKAIGDLAQDMAHDAQKPTFKPSESVGGYVDRLTHLNRSHEPELALPDLFRKSIQKARENKHNSGLSWPLQRMTSECGRSLSGRVIWVQASPSTDKSALALQWNTQIALNDQERGDIIALESGGDLSNNTDRMIMSILGRDFKRYGGISPSEEERILHNAAVLQERFRITERPKTCEQIRAYAMQAVDEGSRMIMIDCLKHIRELKGESLYEKFRYGSEFLCHLRDDLAGEANACCFHHLTEEGKSRQAGNDIFEDADVDIRLTREQEPGLIRFDVAKNRNGPLPAPAVVRFDGERQEFDDSVDHPV